MLDYAGSALKKIQEFIKEIGKLKAHDAEIDNEIEHLKREIDLVHKQLQFSSKVANHMSLDVEALKQRVKSLESQKHGLAIKLGKQKAANLRLTASKPASKPKH
jgi:hypothetical protein